jgi:hydrogenase/urease accessory protein HupE
MKRINLVVIIWILTSIIGGIMKIYKFQFANFVLGMSLIVMIIGLFLIVKDRKKVK